MRSIVKAQRIFTGAKMLEDHAIAIEGRMIASVFPVSELRTGAEVIDLGAGIDRTVRFIAAAADSTVIVTTDEPTALTDAYAFIKLSHAAGHGDNIKIVVNMSADVKEGEGTYNTLLKACKNFLKLTPPLIGIIRQDKRVKEAIRAQTPYLTRSPNTDTAQDIEKIARRVTEEILA